MTQVWIYTVGASPNPDKVDCVVPWRVDDASIFFGPCMKRIRRRIRQQYLGPDCTHTIVTEPLFIVGVNGSNKDKIRKIVWAGRVSEVMTFAEAYKRLTGDRFRDMLADRLSPLHVRPKLERGKLVGYDHVSDEHLKGEAW